MAMSESIFLAKGEHFIPTEHARGPWDPGALHGGAPAALLTAAFERVEPGSELTIARLGFEFLRPVPMGPLTLSTRIVRPGRRVQELAGELTSASSDGPGGEQVVCRASALRVTTVPLDLPEPVTAQDGSSTGIQTTMPPPESARAVPFVLGGAGEAGFGSTGMEIRWLDQPRTLGPGRAWMRPALPLLPGQPLSALARIPAIADFGNGVSAALPFDRFLFINADLSIHLHRPARGEWIGLDARTLLDPGGTGVAESVVHDLYGPIGRAFQTLVVQPR
jgi:acyl-coenzyme A thioesterase PaaI-like protein